MKTRMFAVLATVLLCSSCLRGVKFPEPTGDYVTMEDVQKRVEQFHYDVAIINTTGDTQVVQYYRLGSDTVVFDRYTADSPNTSESGCFMGCISDSSSPYNFIPMGDTAMQIKVGKVPSRWLDFKLTDIVRGDTAIEYNMCLYGAVFSHNVLLLFGDARRLEDPLSNAEVQQLIMMPMVEVKEAEEGMTEAMEELGEAERTLLETDTMIVAPGCNANRAFERLQKKAAELHYGMVELRHKPEHRGCTFSCTNLVPIGDKACYRHMEKMSKAVGKSHLEYTVQHQGSNHARCTFVAHN